jgi:hypothetical protein
MEMVPKEHSGMTQMSSIFRSIDTMAGLSTLPAISVLSIWSEQEQERASEYRHLRATWTDADARSVNIAWPTSGFGDGDYIYAFQKIVMPIAYEFDPDLVISESCICIVRKADLTSSLCRIRCSRR